MRPSAFVSSLLLAFFLPGCGGGGGNTSTPEPAAPPVLAMVAGNAGGPSGYIDATGADARFTSAGPIVADAAGTLYVTEGSTFGGNHAVRRITPRAEVSTLYRVADNLAAVIVGAGVDGSGGVYFGQWNYCGLRCLQAPTEVRRIEASGLVTTLPVTGSSDGSERARSQITALARDDLGTVYIGFDSGHVQKLAADGNLTAFLPPGSAGQVGGIAVDGMGNVHVAIADPVGLVRRISPSGHVTVLAQIPDPRGVAVDGDGNLYVAYPKSHVVRKITPGGAISVIAGVEGQRGFVAGPLPGLLDSPTGLAIAGRDLYITLGTGVAVIHNRP